MTVPASPIPHASLVGDGVSVNFVFGFPYYPATHGQTLIVTRNGVVTGTYTLVINPEQEVSPGGTVTFAVAPTAGEKVVIERATPQSQLLDLLPAFPIGPAGLEAALDKLVMMVQEMWLVVSLGIGNIFATINTWTNTNHFDPPNDGTPGIEVTTSSAPGIAVTVSSTGTPTAGITSTAQGANVDAIQGLADGAGRYAARLTGKDAGLPLRLALTGTHTGEAASSQGRINIDAPANSGGQRVSHLRLTGIAGDPNSIAAGDVWYNSTDPRLKVNLGGNTYDASDKLRWRTTAVDINALPDDVGSTIIFTAAGKKITMPGIVFTKAGRIDILAPLGCQIVGGAFTPKSLVPGSSHNFGLAVGATLTVAAEGAVSIFFPGDGTYYVVGGGVS